MHLIEDTTQKLVKKLHSGKNLKIVITTHHKPDGDALGSSLAMYFYLNSLGHISTVITPTDYPKFLHWMPGNEDVLIFEENKKMCLNLVEQADLIFCLDFNDLLRINELGEPVKNAKAEKVMIDHHLDPVKFDDYRFRSHLASSTCELVYNFIKKSGDTEKISSQIADCIYTGIMTDTGSFKFSGTTSETHRIIADLIDKGAKNTMIHEFVYDTNSLSRLKMMGYILYHKIEIIPELKTVLISLSKEELAEYNIKTGDTEGFVNYGLSIEGIKLSVLIIDRTRLVKISFRSKGDFACNEFAKKHFEGGGHKNAAGGQSSTTLEETIKKFREIIPLYKKQLQ
ncbi:MAG: DHH family phosphoesterase [Bacteroidetes bacterium]|nr:DHH family phosphoesterase [Bacteroidota bacterium]